MKTINLETARNYANSAKYVSINSFINTKTFGEKGGHTAFCSIHFEYKIGGAGSSFQISKSNFLLLKKEGFKVNINEQGL